MSQYVHISISLYLYISLYISISLCFYTSALLNLSISLYLCIPQYLNISISLYFEISSKSIPGGSETRKWCFLNWLKKGKLHFRTMFFLWNFDAMLSGSLYLGVSLFLYVYICISLLYMHIYIYMSISRQTI